MQNMFLLLTVEKAKSDRECSVELFYWVKLGLFYRLFSVFSNNKFVWKMSIQYTYSARIRTHNLRNMSRLPEPLDQGSVEHIS